MSKKTAALPERVEAYLTRSGLAGKSSVLPLTGDASDRKYFRVLTRGGRSIVLALHADTFDPEALPFLRVAELFLAMPLPVPAILDRAPDLGILALEDLGDVTLQAHLGTAPTSEHRRLYREAVGLIEALQRRGSELSSSDSPPYRIAFDIEKLTWELEFFTKHFLEAYRGVAIADGAREALAGEWRTLAEQLASEPRVLCHRDYHSRNLMLHDNRLYIIDFQDARLGPDTYDLVSLLRDSYVELPESVVDDLVAYFIALKRPAGTPGDTWQAWESDFRGRFDVMALQRNLKALGTFGYQTSIRQNPVYIQYIPRTLHHVQQNLTRHERFGRLREILAAFIPELR